MSLCCQNEDRRNAVRTMNGRNGLDYVEVANDQVTLTAYFLGKLPAEFQQENAASPAHLAIEGGRRVREIKVISALAVTDPDPEKDDSLVITVDKPGDFSTYTLRLVDVQNIDPRYGSTEFTFKINCASDLDCAPACGCEPQALDEPEINYLAKDYGSFRQLILDRLAAIMPSWSETHAADLGIALVEVLAYAGDYLSYYQDAVATEAYLDTARLRISVRRLVRLVDYFLHEGCNARAWVAIQTGADFTLQSGFAFITGINNGLSDPRTILTWDDLAGIPPEAYEVFEPMVTGDARILAGNSRIPFYAWGDRECCLERGSTSATLLDAWTGDATRLVQLNAGDVMIFEEILGPHTGLSSDADPARRQAVRITQVTPGEDPVVQDAAGRPTPYLDIEWSADDALRFTFCISAIGPAPACQYRENISVARGNVLLVDHGKTQSPEDFGPVLTAATVAVCECVGEAGEVTVAPRRISAELKKVPLTYRDALVPGAAAASALSQDVRNALPQVFLESAPARTWHARYDLLASDPGDSDFVVELDNDGVAHLRFGDGTLGAQPPAGMTFAAAYRTGNGVAGNVGAESISRVVLPGRTTDPGLVIRNPLSAAGGTAAEPIDEAKLYAPHAFRKQIERAITTDDYETIARRNPKIQRASAQLNWTGSWYEADVAIDPLGTEEAGAGLLDELEHDLNRFREIGTDLTVEQAHYVPIALELSVCVLPQFERAQVKAALLDVFGRRPLKGGAKGFFHPDNLTFGQSLYLSGIVAAGQSVAGVECVTVTKLQRLFEPANGELENGILPLKNNEVGQLDNDPNYPEHGQLTIRTMGGR